MVTCSWCGQVADPPDEAPVDWVVERSPGAPQRQYCPACAREHVRSIEAKLDAEHW